LGSPFFFGAQNKTQTPAPSLLYRAQSSRWAFAMNDDGSPIQPLLSTPCNTDDVEEASIATEPPHRRCPPSRCGRCIRDKFTCGIFVFALFAWFGFMSSIYTAYSCNIVLVDWNHGQVQLTISGIGPWRYQRLVSKDESMVPNHNRHLNYQACSPYGAAEHSEIHGMEEFFPISSDIQTFSILAPSISFGVIVGVIFFMVIVSIHTDNFTQSRNNPSYPWKTITIGASLGGVGLILAGFFQGHTIYLLMLNHSSKSPICNDEYSICRYGPSGHFAWVGVASLYLAGFTAFFGAYTTLYDRRRRQ
jgi:hypothetical protein